MESLCTINNKEILFLKLENGWEKHLLIKDWCLFIVSDTKSVLADDALSICIKQKPLYICSAGIESEWLHDFADEISVLTENFVMTTWSRNVKDEFWFAVNNAQCENGIIRTIVCIDLNFNDSSRFLKLVSVRTQ